MPHITIARPIVGLEPQLYECLAATFRQTYPREKLTVFFCVSRPDDPAIPIVEQLLKDFPEFRAKLVIEHDDAYLQEQDALFGPNPKIRNMSRAYREAEGDLIWIIDCNVWVAKGVAGRLVDCIEGWSRGLHGKKQKFVHQLPLVVDVTESENAGVRDEVTGSSWSLLQARSTSTAPTSTIRSNDLSDNFASPFALSTFGGRLEELFLSSSHAKFYTSINTVLVAPCIVGKSNMFRRSHLNTLTSESPGLQGLDHFSHNICEDHLIGDLLWKKKVPEEIESGEDLGRHAMVYGDLVIQPMAYMSIAEYFARRVRWLRVRKFTVTAATLVEPSTESFLCSFYGAYGMTANPWVQSTFGVPQTWTSFALLWIMSICLWALIDWTMYRILHSMASIEVDESTPQFARHTQRSRRPFHEWLVAWVGRETLALPIWTWAVFGGVTVKWRGRRYRVGMDMKVHAIDDFGTFAAPLSAHGSEPNRLVSRTPDRIKARRE